VWGARASRIPSPSRCLTPLVVCPCPPIAPCEYHSHLSLSFGFAEPLGAPARACLKKITGHMCKARATRKEENAGARCLQNPQSQIPNAS
jgi:hypothetical protein